MTTNKTKVGAGESSPPTAGSALLPSSDTFLEMAAEIVDPVEWVALQMTKIAPKPDMTRGEAMDMVKAIVREGFKMMKRKEMLDAANNPRPIPTQNAVLSGEKQPQKEV